MAYCEVNDVLRRFGKTEGNLPSSWGIDVATINAFIDNNEAIIDDLYNGTFEQATYENEYHDAPGRDDEIVLSNRPVISITSMYRKSGTTTWTELTDLTASQDLSQDGFILRDSSAGIVKLTETYEYPGPSYGDQYSAFDDMYRVTYIAGYSTPPNWVKNLCVDMTQIDIILVLRHNGSTEAKDMLDAYRDTIKIIQERIETGKKRLRRHRRPAVGVF